MMRLDLFCKIETLSRKLDKNLQDRLVKMDFTGSTLQDQSYYLQIPSPLQIPPLKFWISKNIFLFLKENKGKLIRYRYPPLWEIPKKVFRGGLSVGNGTDLEKSRNYKESAPLF